MALVGGRMETVAPQRSLFGPDYLLLAALLAVAAALHGWLVLHTKATARDSIGFARQALRIQSPEASNPEKPNDASMLKIDVIREAQHPPGYPLAVWVTAKFVRRTITPDGADGLYSPLQLAETTLLATQIASAIAAVLLVIPMYVTGRMLFGRSAAFASTLLFQVLPVPAHITSDGLTEGVYLLGMCTSLMLAVRAVRKPGVGGFLLTGLAIGSSYLVRPEAMMAVAAVGLVAAYMGVSRRWPRDLTLGRLAALGVGVMLVAGPYMIVIGGVSNKPTANQMLEENPRSKLWKGQPGANAAPVGGPILAKWMNPPVEGIPSRVLWGAEATAIETFKSLHYLTGAFAMAALVLFRKRIATEPALWVLLAVAALNAMVLTYLGAKVGYVSERHTVLLVMIGCLFAGGALEPVAAGLGRFPAVGGFWAGKFGVPALLVILVGIALPSAFKPLHANREGFKQAGIWLAGQVQKDDCVIDPFCWSDWYAGRTLYYIPKDPSESPAVTYAIVDDKLREDDHERLPRMDAAKNVMNDGRSEVVYCWPEGSTKDNAKVKVYKLVRK
jgi:hypothetical protein